MIIDTSAFIEMIRKGEFIEGSLSVVTVIEILRGVKPGKRKKVKKLLEESFEIIHIGNNVIAKYCELYDALKSKGELIPDADLIIASTALARNETLLTKDIRHFVRLKDLGLKIKIHA